MNNKDLSIYNKVSDISALKTLLDSDITTCHVIMRVVPGFKIDFIKVRSYLIDNLITATIEKEDLIKLENSDQVLFYNVAKSVGFVKTKKIDNN